MGEQVMRIAFEIPGGPFDAEEVLSSLRRAGSTMAEAVDGDGRIFHVTFRSRKDEEVTAWDAICDMAAAFPNSVLHREDAT